MLDRTDEPVALISQQLADQDGYNLGSRVSILGAAGLTELRVVGVLPGFGPVAGTGRTAIVPIDVARAAFGITGVSHLDLQLAPGALDSVTTHLAARMTEPYVLASPREIAANLRASSASFQGTAALVAAIVLFVGAFLIVNTLSMTVGERAREVGLLRAAGATRTQLGRFVFSGALALGIVGSGFGVIIGWAMAMLMAGAVSDATGLSAAVHAVDPAGAITGALVLVTVAPLAPAVPLVVIGGVILIARRSFPSA
jgi:putative ABC transport system permease protein